LRLGFRLVWSERQTSAVTTDQVADPHVLTDIRDGVGWLTLNRPDARNTLTAPMVAEIVQAMDRLEADESVGAVVVTGAGSAFCAGADLGNLKVATRESLGNIYEGFLRIARSPLPTLAAVNGAAVGAGMNLALGCDVRLAARRARFDTRFLQIGLHPGGGHTWMQRRIVGPQAAMAAVVFGQVLDGPEAERVGLVYRCVDDGELLDAAQAFAHGAASAPRQLAIVAKQTIAAMATISEHDEAVARELEPQLWTVQQPWFEQRIAALQATITSKPA
jgi:enoyl-CoA hydratase